MSITATAVCYCGHKFGTQELNLEHVLPAIAWGKTDWTNT